MKRWWALSAGIAVLCAAFVTTGPSEGAGPFSFPHQPHISDAVVTAGLESAAAAMRGAPQRGGGGKVDAECIVCHDFSKDDDAYLSNCTPCHVGDQYLQVEVAGVPTRTRTAFPHSKHIESGELEVPAGVLRAGENSLRLGYRYAPAEDRASGAPAPTAGAPSRSRRPAWRDAAALRCGWSAQTRHWRRTCRACRRRHRRRRCRPIRDSCAPASRPLLA